MTLFISLYAYAKPNSTPPRGRLDSPPTTQARQADTLVEGSSHGLGTTLKLIATKQIYLWKVALFAVFVAGFAAALTLAVATDTSSPTEAALCGNTLVSGLVPLNNLGTGMYKGYQAGLYQGGSNIRPAAHTAAGMAIA